MSAGQQTSWLIPHKRTQPMGASITASVIAGKHDQKQGSQKNQRLGVSSSPARQVKIDLTRLERRNSCHGGRQRRLKKKKHLKHFRSSLRAQKKRVNEESTHIPHAPTIWAHASGAVWKNASMPFADVTSVASNMPKISELEGTRGAGEGRGRGGGCQAHGHA